MNYEDRLFLASLLGLILPGIGHLYLGFVRRGMMVLVIGFAITIGVSIGQSNYIHNGDLLFGYVLFISVFLWIATTDYVNDYRVGYTYKTLMYRQAGVDCRQVLKAQCTF